VVLQEKDCCLNKFIHKNKMNNHKNNLKRDLIIIILSIVVAVILAKTGILKTLLTVTQEVKIVGSVLAGMFFVSIFTAAPAAVALIEIIKANSVLEVALFGGIGALIGDLLIFRFIKNSLSDDIKWLLRKTNTERFSSIFRNKFFKWLGFFIGALIVASPFPDEIGLAMMGLSKTKTALFIPVSFILNFLGILFMGLVVKGIM